MMIAGGLFTGRSIKNGCLVIADWQDARCPITLRSFSARKGAQPSCDPAPCAFCFDGATISMALGDLLSRFLMLAILLRISLVAAMNYNVAKTLLSVGPRQTPTASCKPRPGPCTRPRSLPTRSGLFDDLASMQRLRSWSSAYWTAVPASELDRCLVDRSTLSKKPPSARHTKTGAISATDIGAYCFCFMSSVTRMAAFELLAGGLVEIGGELRERGQLTVLR